MNVIALLEYELAYYDSAVYCFNHYTTKTPPLRSWKRRKAKSPQRKREWEWNFFTHVRKLIYTFFLFSFFFFFFNLSLFYLIQFKFVDFFPVDTLTLPDFDLRSLFFFLLYYFFNSIFLSWKFIFICSFLWRSLKKNSLTAVKF